MFELFLKKGALCQSNFQKKNDKTGNDSSSNNLPKGGSFMKSSSTGPRLIIICGLLGSGKTTFATLLSSLVEKGEKQSL